MDKLKLAEKISKRLKVPFYIARYQTGSPLVGYGHEWFIFFKEKDLPLKAIRFWRRHSLGFRDNEGFAILETKIDSFKNSENKYKICYRNEYGCIYSSNLVICPT